MLANASRFVRAARRVRRMATDRHYEEVGGRYHDAFFYSGAYEAWQFDEVEKRLGLRDTDRFADVGGGTGRFAGELGRRARVTTKPRCVDPSAAMLAEAGAGVERVLADGLSFARGAPDASLDRVLLKEVAHHFGDDDLAACFAELRRALAPGGRMLVVTRPHDPDYPFFDAARAVWRAHQPPAEHFTDALARAGFGRVAADAATYPATLDRDRWLDMVSTRFWSTFSHFDDAALAAGVDEIRRAHPPGDISFSERLVFVAGEAVD